MDVHAVAGFRARAEQLDAKDPLPLPGEFEFPPVPPPLPTSNAPASLREFASCAYFAGNSLGLLSASSRSAVQETLDSWSTRAVSGHFVGSQPWSEQADRMAPLLAKIVGANAHEVTVMNSLTINLHLVLASLYRPTKARRKIAIEAGAFPSDDYAAAAHVRWHGLDSSELVRLAPDNESGLFSHQSLVTQITALGPVLGAVVLGAVNFRTGQLLDIEGLTAVAQRAGAVVIWDLAHAAGNVELKLHDWNVDAAIWCNYKYLNGGPGCPGGLYVHERFASDSSLPRLHGWWGNDADTRFEMRTAIDLGTGAGGWQVSTPTALAMTPLRASLENFDRVGFETLHARSRRLTGFLEELFDLVRATHVMDQITPRSARERGAQLSMLVHDAPGVSNTLRALGVVADERPPNIVRFAPTALTSSFVDCWRAATALLETLPLR